MRRSFEISNKLIVILLFMVARMFSQRSTHSANRGQDVTHPTHFIFYSYARSATFLAAMYISRDPDQLNSAILREKIITMAAKSELRMRKTKLELIQHGGDVIEDN